MHVNAPIWFVNAGRSLQHVQRTYNGIMTEKITSLYLYVDKGWKIHTYLWCKASSFSSYEINMTVSDRAFKQQSTLQCLR